MIRRAKYDDIDNIMHFIDTYWKKGHILGTNREFFEYEHCTADKEVNFVISLDENSDIEAMLGFIPYSKRNADLMTVMWKVREDAKDKTLGIKLIEYILNDINHNIVASPGSNKKVLPIYKYMKFKTERMNHYYRLNKKISDYNIAVINEKKEKDIDISRPSNTITKVKDFDELLERFSFEKYYSLNPKPKKEPWYIEKRYFNHPIYKYQIYTIDDKKEQTDTFIVIRKVKVEKSNVLRIVDIVGDYTKISNITKELDKIVYLNNSEYIDIYNAGLNEEIFLKSGWIDRYNTTNIIPNYFEPFIRENIDIYYFSTDEKIVLFKADGDQDRPS